ncbi:hypothetical protein [Pseudomonas putida]|uniref:Uncharacterized protein n=1 Tax=Pseudomonas putida TaxID=303 RepID=A0A8I1EC98_PSEPU|nr:hypothetical protein [Pseudomonas putida]MBI6882643.1 hypothetical protein [Pseudomonas putida]
MKLFHEVPKSFFRPERAAELATFTKKAAKYVNENGAGAECLIDVLVEDEILWDELLEEKWVQAHNPLVDTRGSLDVAAACMLEGLTITEVWDKVVFGSQRNHEFQLTISGLLGLHFRMDLPSFDDRLKYTALLADELIDIDDNQASDDISLMSALSVRTEGRDQYIADHFSDVAPAKNRLTEAEHRLLMGDSDGDDSHLAQAAEKLLSGKNGKLSEMDRYTLAARVERALLPMVYNHGFRLTHSGVDEKTVMASSSKRISALLAPLKLSEGLEKAIERQILINLFSAFPSGLALLNATTDELQGVMHDPHIMRDPEASFFARTLKGPIFLFGAGRSVLVKEQAEKIISFLSENGHNLDFDQAIQGELGKTHDVLALAYWTKKHSQVLDDAFSGKSEKVSITLPVVEHILQPDVLSLYSDKAILGIVRHAIDNGGLNLTVEKLKLPGGSPSIGPMLKGRGDLASSILDLLAEKKALNQKSFKWCGFGVKELKILGKRAPASLKKEFLENDLGI